MDTYISIIIIVVILSYLIIIYKKRVISHELNNVILESMIKNKLISLITNNELIFDIPICDYQLFKEYYDEVLINVIIDNIKKQGISYLGDSKIKVNLNSIIPLVRMELKSESINTLLSNKYLETINNNIREAEIEENNAIRYHQSFGEEPSGIPELHPKETSSEDSSNIPETYKTLDELMSTGTVEDIT